VIPNHLKAQIMLKNSETSYRLSQAKLDRLLLEGFYRKIAWISKSSDMKN